MRIAVEGCCHGELNAIYGTIKEIETRDKIKIDLLLICGDFQACRNFEDIASMAVPDKWKRIADFYRYYNGELTAPIPTIFIGGNHEASNHLVELFHGGWAAPNIYFLGYAGVVRFAGLRIAGLSGIYKPYHYHSEHFESFPLVNGDLRSIYHYRETQVWQLKQLSGELDIVLTHDWPNQITKYGDENRLLQRKKHFREDIEKEMLGSPACWEILTKLKPKYYFSAHLHCKFAAVVNHDEGSTTRFLALDKCLPRKAFLQILEVDAPDEDAKYLSYDPEWLAILRATHHHLKFPGELVCPRPNEVDVESHKEAVKSAFPRGFRIPDNWVQTIKPEFNLGKKEYEKRDPPHFIPNPQTALLLGKLGLKDRWAHSSTKMHGGKRETSVDKLAIEPVEGWAPDLHFGFGQKDESETQSLLTSELSSAQDPAPSTKKKLIGGSFSNGSPTKKIKRTLKLPPPINLPSSKRKLLGMSSPTKSASSDQTNSLSFPPRSNGSLKVMPKKEKKSIFLVSSSPSPAKKKKSLFASLPPPSHEKSKKKKKRRKIKSKDNLPDSSDDGSR